MEFNTCNTSMIGKLLNFIINTFLYYKNHFSGSMEMSNLNSPIKNMMQLNSEWYYRFLENL